MIDRSLLSHLPPSDLIRLAALHPPEAAAHFRVAARFCLDGASCVAFRDLEQKRLAHRLIADGRVGRRSRRDFCGGFKAI